MFKILAIFVFVVSLPLLGAQAGYEGSRIDTQRLNTVPFSNPERNFGIAAGAPPRAVGTLDTDFLMSATSSSERQTYDDTQRVARSKSTLAPSQRTESGSVKTASEVASDLAFHVGLGWTDTRDAIPNRTKYIIISASPRGSAPVSKLNLGSSTNHFDISPADSTVPIRIFSGLSQNPALGSKRSPSPLARGRSKSVVEDPPRSH